MSYCQLDVSIDAPGVDSNMLLENMCLGHVAVEVTTPHAVVTCVTAAAWMTLRVAVLEHADPAGMGSRHLLALQLTL